jgi:CheY-like chemotaxis protein
VVAEITGSSAFCAYGSSGRVKGAEARLIIEAPSLLGGRQLDTYGPVAAFDWAVHRLLRHVGGFLCEIAASCVPDVSTETNRRCADMSALYAGCTISLQVHQMQQGQNRLDIVIYEEDSLTRALLREWLSEAGYQVRIGRSHDANLDRPADLVIVNVYMPKNAGAQWVRDIQMAHPETPIIAISGQFRSGLCASGATAKALGVRQVVAKPLIRGDLLDAVRRIKGGPG